MMRRIRDGLAWRLRPWWRYAYLAGSFRNGLKLASYYHRRLPCERVVLWDGTILSHPPARSGMLETIFEVWFDQVYTGGFYNPSGGDVIIDGGANVGIFSVWFARRHPHCRVLAFEPFEENYRVLEQNIASAGVANITAFRAGLGGESGFGEMEAVGARSLDHRLKLKTEKGDRGIQVYSFGDAQKLAASQRIALFKVDIEGSEYDLFCRAHSKDLARVDRFAVEYHEHVRPGVLELIGSKLEPTHDMTVTAHCAEYGMLYATRRIELADR